MQRNASGKENVMQIQLININKLIEYDKNPRKNAKAIEVVKNSIAEFGFKVPIVVDKDMIIVAGHTRYKASLELGLKEVPCIVADDLTEEQVKAFRLADNKTAEFAEWDFDLLFQELEELKGILDMEAFGFEEHEEKIEVKDDEYEVAPPAEPKAKHGDVYKLGNHRLMCGDSTLPKDVAKLMDGNLVDLVLTDPPYNVDYEGTAGKIENDYMEATAFEDFLAAAFMNFKEYLKRGGVILHIPRFKNSHGI